MAVVLGILFIPLGDGNGTIAQVMGEKAEMERLEVKAEEAMANGDPNGATLAIGRAALMASMLAKKEGDPQIKLFYEGTEDLFRTQENAYRALALFEQAGGQSPAPSGVCQLLSLSENRGRKAKGKLSKAASYLEGDTQKMYDSLTEKVQEWIQIIDDLQADFLCR